MEYTIEDICKNTNSSLLTGDKNHIINSIDSIKSTSKSSIIFIRNKKFLLSLNSKSITCLTSPELAQELTTFKNIIVSNNLDYSFALLTKLFASSPETLIDENIYPFKGNKFNVGYGTIISKSAKIGNNVTIGSNCVIEKNVVIGDNTTIDHHVVIYESSFIGRNARISSGVVIGSQGFGFARRLDTWEPIRHIGSIVIGDNVSIGSNSCLDRGTIENTTIGNNVIIDNLVHIAHNVSIGAGTAIAAKVGIAGSTSVGKNCLIGGMVGIFGHLEICDNVVISPKSNVYRNIKKTGHYSSLFPLLPHSIWRKISILLSKLDKINFFQKK